MFTEKTVDRFWDKVEVLGDDDCTDHKGVYQNDF